MIDENGCYTVAAHVASLTLDEVRYMLDTIPSMSIGSPLHVALLERYTRETGGVSA